MPISAQELVTLIVQKNKSTWYKLRKLDILNSHEFNIVKEDCISDI